MKTRPAAELDTLTWLLTTEGCPYCGEPDAVAQERCSACGRSQTIIIRPQQRSLTVTSLASLWILLAIVALVLAVGAWLQLSGRMPLPQAQDDSAIIRNLAKLAGIKISNTSYKAVAPPAWFVPTMMIMLVTGLGMAWGTFARKPWAFYTGLGLSMLPALLGVFAALQLRGSPTLIVLISGILLSGFLIILHLATTKQMLGERSHISSATSATSALDLYYSGLEHMRQDMIYLGARHLARAFGKNPSSSDVLELLALALEQLGLPERAQSMRKRSD